MGLLPKLKIKVNKTAVEQKKASLKFNRIVEAFKTLPLLKNLERNDNSEEDDDDDDYLDLDQEQEEYNVNFLLDSTKIPIDKSTSDIEVHNTTELAVVTEKKQAHAFRGYSIFECRKLVENRNEILVGGVVDFIKKYKKDGDFIKLCIAKEYKGIFTHNDSIPEMVFILSKSVIRFI